MADQPKPRKTAFADSLEATLLRRYEAAQNEHKRWQPLWQECFEHALPGRPGFTQVDTAGRKFTDRMFDMTGAISLQEFASRLQAGMTPTFARWSKIVPGRRVPDAERVELEKQLEVITEEVFAAIHRSNFDAQIHEAYLDLGVGTGSLICDEDSTEDLRFTAVPLPQMVLDSGPFDSLDGRFRVREMSVREIGQTWRKFEFPQAIRTDSETARDRKLKVVEATTRDWSVVNDEAYDYRVLLPEHKHIGFTARYEGVGSCPWINFRWSKAAGETYGRGPLLMALPNIKVANLANEMILDNAEMQIAGMWQMDDDGVVNPNSVQLVPGTIIPVASNSRGLQPLAPPGKFDVSQLLLENLRGDIKRALFDQMLGPPTGTPMSATEVSERTADLYRRIGSAYGRLQRELVQPIVRRVVYILRKKGRIKAPQIGPGVMQIVSVSPLASAQAQEDVLKFQQFAGMIAGTFGPQLVAMLLKPYQSVDWLATQQGIRKDLIYSEAEQQQMQQQLMQAAMGAAGAAGQAPAAGAPAPA